MPPPMRRRSEMPTEEEILRTQLWTIGHLIEKRKDAVRFAFYIDNPAEPIECEVATVIYDPSKDHLQIILKATSAKDTTVAKEPEQGTPQPD